MKLLENTELRDQIALMYILFVNIRGSISET
jgi:hypothetical protein